jgi:hypothetical protein
MTNRLKYELSEWWDCWRAALILIVIIGTGLFFLTKIAYENTSEETYLTWVKYTGRRDITHEEWKTLKLHKMLYSHE